MTQIQLIQGDITQAEIDIIVNAANPIMLGGGGVDGAIHRAAGPTLLEACRKVKAVDGIRCPTGEARITTAGKLKASYVIHTVGPRYRYEKEPAKLLISCYQQSIELAQQHGCQSIAFPAISCGAYGYPAEQAANISLETCLAHAGQTLSVYFYLREAALYSTYENALAELMTNAD